ncbi:GNAT family N-acetyltransferase [Lacibacterium aquatile]|uniref:GNAT family N-acetyltransferase n=1 Tax=Lacibacterium aquatile TaxID=1168082 RepID=A0ABW5DWV3_9PROT
MTVRNLDALFAPKAIALIGASRDERSVGAVLARNLFRGGFKGPIMPVHPHDTAVEGVLSYRTVADLPMKPDLAVIAADPAAVPGLIAELGVKGCRAAIVVTDDFGAEKGANTAVLTQHALTAARPYLMRIVGPNCLGVLVPGLGINASFAHVGVPVGDIACVTQSVTVASALLDWSAARGIGFSHLVSLGDMADVDIGDMLDYLQTDPKTHAVLLYLEEITSARKFMSAARAISRMKPVIVVKSGRYRAQTAAAHSHTGALAGSDAVYDAAFRRAGMLRVRDMEEMFAAVETLARVPGSQGDRLAIVTNGGGIGALATDVLLDEGGLLADLSAETIAKLDEVLPDYWSRSNPVDLGGDAGAERYAAALDILLADPKTDAVLLLNSPSAVVSTEATANAVIATLRARPRNLPKRPVLAAWVGGQEAMKARARFNTAGQPSYATPTAAIRGFMHLAKYRRNQELLMEAPPATPSEIRVDAQKVESVLAKAADDGRDWLDEAEAKAVLAAYGIPVVPTLPVKTPAEVAVAVAGMKPPFAVKIRSRDIDHKSDVGGVVLDLETPAAAKIAAQGMIERVKALKPDAEIDGFTVQEMVRRPASFELILGATQDPVFGPVLLFGHGGVAVEVRGDKALALPPLNMTLARDVIGRTRISKLLQGYRNRPPADLEAIVLSLIRVSQLVIDHPEIVELDINPLLVDVNGVVALDARIRQSRATPVPLAVPAYPNELEHEMTLRDGTRMLLRPIRPEDAPGVQHMFGFLDPEDIRLRFFQPLKALPRPLVARLTQIDYDREMAFVACPLDGDMAGEIWGVVRLTCDPDLIEGEYAVLVRSDIKGRGLGMTMMHHICDYGRRRGVGAIVGTILRENARMLEITQELGFTAKRDPDDPGVVDVRLELAQESLSSRT